MSCHACEHSIPLDENGNHDFKLGDCTFLDVQCPISRDELEQLPGPFALSREDVPTPR